MADFGYGRETVGTKKNPVILSVSEQDSEQLTVRPLSDLS